MQHKRPRGFSLLELMITIGIIGIVAAIAVPAYARHRANLQLKATADQVAAALREAQSTSRMLADGAIVDQSKITYLPSSTNRFTVYALRGGTPSATGGGELSYSVAVATSAPNQNVHFVETAFSAGAFVDVGGSRVFFAQDGTVADGRARTLTISNGDQVYQVTLSQQGTVTVSGPQSPPAE